MRLVEKILGVIGNKEDILVDGKLYLRRWRLAGYNAKLPYLFGRSVMVHRLLLPDQDKNPHDHPWSFWTLVLKGGYVEHVYLTRDRRRARTDDDQPVSVVRGLFALDWRPAEHMHRIDALPDGDAWTFLVTRGEREHKWGFWTKQGWVYWKWYPHGVVPDSVSV
jgi:lipid-A-disaccharide synthase-like uncharacterized protein